MFNSKSGVNMNGITILVGIPESLACGVGYTARKDDTFAM